MKKTRMYLLGSSVLGLALCAAATAGAEGDVKVDSTAVETTAAPEAAVAAPAPPEDKDKPRGLYMGGSVGGSFFEGPSHNSRIFNHSTGDANQDGVPDAFTVTGIDDENNFMWSVFAGYRLADWLGAEVGWTDIGGFRAIADNPPHFDETNVNVDGVEARLRAWLPLGTEWVSAIVGPGIFIYSSHAARICDGSECAKSAFGKEAPALDPREDSGQAFTLSAGLQFRVTDNILIRTEYAHFFSVLDQGVDMITASVVFGFYDFFNQGKTGGSDFGGIAVE